MEYENDQRGYDGMHSLYKTRSDGLVAVLALTPPSDEPQYERNRSRSPRADRDGDTRIRSASPGGRNNDRYINVTTITASTRSDF